MSKNNHITNKLTNGKNSYFVTYNESIEPKEDISNNIDLLEKQIDFLKEECQNKNLNILLEQLFQTTTSKLLNTGNLDKSMKTIPNGCYEYP